jgi:hypothetical protein
VRAVAPAVVLVVDAWPRLATQSFRVLRVIPRSAAIEVPPVARSACYLAGAGSAPSAGVPG